LLAQQCDIVWIILNAESLFLLRDIRCFIITTPPHDPLSDRVQKDWKYMKIDWQNMKIHWQNMKIHWKNMKIHWQNTKTNWQNTKKDWQNTKTDWQNTKIDWVTSYHAAAISSVISFWWTKYYCGIWYLSTRRAYSLLSYYMDMIWLRIWYCPDDIILLYELTM